MTIPTYDFPQSPILIIGFFGIMFTLVLLYFVNRAYFDSPLNMDNIHRNKDSWNTGTLARCFCANID